MVGKASIPFTRLVKPLGVTFDAALSFDQHASTVVRSCFFHVRSLSEDRSYLPRKAANSIALSLVLPKLDYCNSLLASLPLTQSKCLQAAQNAAAKTVTKCKENNHITPILRQLHWLLVHDRIPHRLLSATHFSVHRNAPLYLFYTPSHPLRSASRSLLDTPRPRDSKTKRSVSKPSGMLLPLSVPGSIRESDFIQSFKTCLKAHSFSCS